MNFISLRNIDVNGKVVLLRADLNVPTKDGIITDYTRIDRVKKTIDYLRKNGAKTIVMSHFGRPKGKVNKKYSLKFIVPSLSERWECDVAFFDDCLDEQARKNINNGEVRLLENVRFYEGEENNCSDFAKKLAKGADIFVNDAFSAAHRAHASTEAIAHILPSACGFLMEEELNCLNKALENPQKPVAAIVGGAKISTKLDLLNNLVKKVDILVLGGGMANNFIYAQGGNIGNSLCEKEMKDIVIQVIENAKNYKCKIILPIDGVASKEFKENPETFIVKADDIPDDLDRLDIGDKTIDMIKSELADVKTLIWNGPMGAFEMKPFDHGTNELAKFVADKTISGDMISVAGGGDTVAALENAGVSDKFTYISTAGGAFLEWLEGKTLPAVAALIKQ